MAWPGGGGSGTVVSTPAGINCSIVHGNGASRVTVFRGANIACQVGFVLK